MNNSSIEIVKNNMHYTLEITQENKIKPWSPPMNSTLLTISVYDNHTIETGLNLACLVL